MRKTIQMLLACVLLLSLVGCTPTLTEYSSEAKYDTDYDYDKGYGYTEPTPGQSFTDYLKEQDPDLYEAIVGNYNDAISDYLYD